MDKKQGMVSIIIPVYNTEKYIEETIRSIEEQTYKNYEIIVINDGSTDRTQKICERLKIRNNRILLLEQKNKGVSHARNIGLNIAKGEFVAFIDSDDILEKTYIEKFVNSITENNCDMVICGFYEKYSNLCIKNEITKRNSFISVEDALNGVMNQNNVKGFLWNKFFKKSIIDMYAIRFDESINICEDSLFVCKYIQYIEKIYVIPECMYYYRMRRSSLVWERKKDRTNEMLDVYEKIYDIFLKKDIKVLDVYLYNYLCVYFQNKKSLKNKNIIINVDKEYKKILKSKNINNKNRIKLIIKKHIPDLFRMYMKIKIKKYNLYE